MENNSLENNDLNTLEDSGAAKQAGGDNKKPAVSGPQQPKKKKFGGRAQDLITRINIYLLLFILIIVIATGVIFVGIQNQRKEEAPTQIKTEELTQDAIDKLKGSDAKVGDPKQTLSIESNAIFSGKVLIRDDLDVAGTIKVGGALSLPGITVSGVSNFDQIQANNLAIAGNTSVQGQLTVQRGINISGSATFGGPVSMPQLTVTSLKLDSDLQINYHIDAGGPTPGKTDGSALGSGGTSSVSGTDTAGTVTINTGSGAGAGCFITVRFNRRFNQTPHIVITPNDSDAANQNYYINRSTTEFSICVTSDPPDGQSFGFDYIAID